MKLLTSLIKKTALIGFVLVAITSCSIAQKGDFVNINSDQVSEIIKTENAILIDVRSEAEVSQGFIEGTTVFINVNGDNFEKKINELDKSKTYIVYCRSGARSANASNKMTQYGFKKVYNLKGGISNWNGSIVTH